MLCFGRACLAAATPRPLPNGQPSAAIDVAQPTWACWASQAMRFSACQWVSAVVGRAVMLAAHWAQWQLFQALPCVLLLHHCSWPPPPPSTSTLPHPAHTSLPTRGPVCGCPLLDVHPATRRPRWRALAPALVVLPAPPGRRAAPPLAAVASWGFMIPLGYVRARPWSTHWGVVPYPPGLSHCWMIEGPRGRPAAGARSPAKPQAPASLQPGSGSCNQPFERGGFPDRPAAPPAPGAPHWLIWMDACCVSAPQAALLQRLAAQPDAASGRRPGACLFVHGRQALPVRRAAGGQGHRRLGAPAQAW